MEQTTTCPVAREPAPDAKLPQLEPIAHVLHRSTAELRALSGLLTEMEETIACLSKANRNRETLQRLQNADILSQSITELSNFLESLAHSTPSDWLVCAAPAAQKVRLSSLAARLGSDWSSGVQNKPLPSNEVEIFT